MKLSSKSASFVLEICSALASTFASLDANAQCGSGSCPPCESCRVGSAAGMNPATDAMATLFDRIATGPRAYGNLGWNFGGTDTIGAGAGCCDANPATPCNDVAVTFPCLLLKAIYYTESGWRQFCATNRTVIAFDCGYGIAQVTSGMRRGENSAFDPNRVASDPAYNVSVGAAILAGKWRAAACVGANNPNIIEHWYFAVWGYNGFAFSNNPNNPAYRADRPEFNSNAGATNRRAYPYQELVYGFLHNSPGAAHWVGRAVGYPRRAEICAGCGFPMASVSATVPETPGTCGPVVPMTPRFAAQFVMQSFPVAATTLDLAAGAEQRGFFDMRNTGTEIWRPGEIFFGTTQMRDRASMARGSDWVAANRPATVDRVVMPGQMGRFNFSLRAPNTVGQEYSEFFGMVRETVAWFSDPAQGGPPDNVLQVRVRATSMAAADSGVVVMDSGVVNPRMDSGVAVLDVASDASSRDSGIRADARRYAADGAPIFEDAGCGCRVGVGANQQQNRSQWYFVLAGGIALMTQRLNRRRLRNNTT